MPFSNCSQYPVVSRDSANGIIFSSFRLKRNEMERNGEISYN